MDSQTFWASKVANAQLFPKHATQSLGKFLYSVTNHQTLYKSSENPVPLGKSQTEVFSHSSIPCRGEKYWTQRRNHPWKLVSTTWNRFSNLSRRETAETNWNFPYTVRPSGPGKSCRNSSGGGRNCALCTTTVANDGSSWTKRCRDPGRTEQNIWPDLFTPVSPDSGSSEDDSALRFEHQDFHVTLIRG